MQMSAVNPARCPCFWFHGTRTPICLPDRACDLFGLLPMPFAGIGDDSYACAPLICSLLIYKLCMYMYVSLLFFTAADLFTDLENAFQGKIDAAYFETSKYLLDVLNKKYSLLDHMQAMRRYLLLGQGDFIRHLMDLLK